MPILVSTHFRPLWLAVLALLFAAATPAGAARADRNQPMVIEADRTGTFDLQRQVLVYAGNVVITQGSMVLRADRVEMRETPDGYRVAWATGLPGKPATWRQRRDGVDETMEGSADRIVYDGRGDTLQLLGNSAVRRLRGSTVADEIIGAEIVWDNLAEIFKVEGGPATAANPGGRVRAVLSPRTVAPAAGDAASSAPAPGVRR